MEKTCFSFLYIVIYNHCFELYYELCWNICANYFPTLCTVHRGASSHSAPQNPSVPKFTITTMLSCSCCTYYNLLCTLSSPILPSFASMKLWFYFYLILSVLFYLLHVILSNFNNMAEWLYVPLLPFFQIHPNPLLPNSFLRLAVQLPHTKFFTCHLQQLFWALRCSLEVVQNVNRCHYTFKTQSLCTVVTEP